MFLGNLIGHTLMQRPTMVLTGEFKYPIIHKKEKQTNLCCSTLLEMIVKDPIFKFFFLSLIK